MRDLRAFAPHAIMLRTLHVHLILTVALLPASVQAQLTINEASSRNAHTVADAAGKYHDWLELHNAGPSAVDLAGYTLTDDPLDQT